MPEWISVCIVPIYPVFIWYIASYFYKCCTMWSSKTENWSFSPIMFSDVARESSSICSSGISGIKGDPRFMFLFFIVLEELGANSNYSFPSFYSLDFRFERATESTSRQSKAAKSESSLSRPSSSEICLLFLIGLCTKS
jgi:hypothetical protein